MSKFGLEECECKMKRESEENNRKRERERERERKKKRERKREIRQGKKVNGRSFLCACVYSTVVMM